MKSRVANFLEKKRDSTFEVFWLWKWDVVAGVLL